LGLAQWQGGGQGQGKNHRLGGMGRGRGAVIPAWAMNNSNH
jgi:hypothetical protein